MSLTSFFESKLEKRRLAGNLRHLKPQLSMIDFSSNDYLGMTRKLKGTELTHKTHGSTGSRLLSGNTTFAEELESKIAAFHGKQAALLYNCGYMANCGLIPTVAAHGDLILYDTHVHASCHDGIRLSHAESIPWKHNSVKDLEIKLKSKRSKHTFVCIESLYSTDGSLAPLVPIAQLCDEHQAYLIVDEAHAVGVFGENGKGLVAEHNLNENVFAQVITFGKALGTYGAAILGSTLLKQYLINFSRSFIFTTALPLHNLIAIDAAYSLLPNCTQERTHLKELIEHLNLSQTPIQPYFVSSNRQAHRMSDLCKENGLNVSALLRPTVLRNQECLRICLHAFNTHDEVEILLKILHGRKP
ncbi:MAG: aminotransferase class I/II-fold pyridoxal phosphate-dependent enzyme [Rhabdochlamydiaceae bacterium]|nr:aminotransferase class I/II-fold pyridoxal phosphate-dependent enzyme [Rhabdochlamydiaceae bacterium]